MATLRSHTPARPQHILRSHTDLPQQTSVRSSPIHATNYYRDDADAGPWQHMAHTYAWVVEQELFTQNKHDRKTKQWILEQQVSLAADWNQQPRRRTDAQQRMWEEMVYSYEIDAERWMRHEELRRTAAEREREKARIVQEELRRIEARIRYKREAERRKFAEEEARMYAEHRERENRERARMGKITLDAWRSHEARWATIVTSSEPLTFASIPWPVITPPTKAEDITPAAIVSLLFSSLHSQSQSRKDRIRSAQLRWHPDRFQRLLRRVAEGDKVEVEKGVGIVARCLNDLMARETTTARHVRL